MGLKEFFKNKRVLITGSNGFIGKNLVEVFEAADIKIYGLGRREKSEDPLINYYKCDITNREALEEVLLKIKPNFIFNLAAKVTAARDYSLYNDMIDLHMKSLFYFYEILKDKDYLDLFINIGSTEEYGDYNGTPFKEFFFEKSYSPYAVTKTAGVHFAYMIGKCNNFPIISIRPSVLFGKYQEETKFTQYVIHRLVNNQTLDLTPCEHSRDFIYVKTFIRILIDLIKSSSYNHGEIYNIASGKSIKLKYFVELTRNLLDSNSKINFGAFKYRENEIMNFNVSMAKTNSILNKIIEVDLENDLKSYLNNIIKNGGQLR